MKDPVKETEVAHHPVSGHRNPDELTKDAAGPMSDPDRDVIAGKEEIPPKRKVANEETDLSPFGRPSKPE